jgi:hypothetical protein
VVFVGVIVGSLALKRNYGFAVEIVFESSRELLTAGVVWILFLNELGFVAGLTFEFSILWFVLMHGLFL